MKKIFLVLLLIPGLASANEESLNMLTCHQEEEIISRVNDIPSKNCTEAKTLELEAKNIFEPQITLFNEKTAKKILTNNTWSANNLARKGTQDLREHYLCLEKICDSLWFHCSGGKGFAIDYDQFSWCYNLIEDTFEIEKLKVKTALNENQNRKNRSTLREKFRAIENRMHAFFLPNLHEFSYQIKKLISKVTAFVLFPL